MTGEKRNLIWITDDDGNPTNVLDADEVASFWRGGKEVRINLKGNSELSLQVFPDEESATRYGNQIAHMMGVDR